MKPCNSRLAICLLSVLLLSISPLYATTIQEAWSQALGDREGVFVFLDPKNDENNFISNITDAEEPAPPCSTFKIWNSLIGLETKSVTNPDAPFWKWDGKERFLSEWNKDQTLRSAFASSCVPAYQNLARKIGTTQMQQWLDSFGYGNRDISAGIDVFWLPSPPDRKTILISPADQARNLARLFDDELPVSQKSIEILSDISTLKTSPLGVFHGKTGTGSIGDGRNLAWFVGWLDHKGTLLPFACLLKGKNLSGKDARAAVETTLTKAGLL